MEFGSVADGFELWILAGIRFDLNDILVVLRFMLPFFLLSFTDNEEMISI